MCGVSINTETITTASYPLKYKNSDDADLVISHFKKWVQWVSVSLEKYSDCFQLQTCSDFTLTSFAPANSNIILWKSSPASWLNLIWNTCSKSKVVPSVSFLINYIVEHPSAFPGLDKVGGDFIQTPVLVKVLTLWCARRRPACSLQEAEGAAACARLSAGEFHHDASCDCLSRSLPNAWTLVVCLLISGAMEKYTHNYTEEERMGSM